MFNRNNVIIQAAIQHVVPQHTQHLPSEGRSSQSSIPAVTVANDFVDMTASTSNETQRLLSIDIEYEGRILTTLKVVDVSTIGNLFLHLSDQITIT